MKKKSYWQSIRSILLFPAAAAINIFADKSLPVHMRPDSTLGHRRPSVIANGHAIGDLDHAHDLRRVHRKGFISDARTHFGRAWHEDPDDHDDDGGSYDVCEPRFTTVDITVVWTGPAFPELQCVIAVYSRVPSLDDLNVNGGGGRS